MTVVKNLENLENYYFKEKSNVIYMNIYHYLFNILCNA
jgi:hypothetical protein